MVIAEVPEPVSDGSVLIEVHAAGISFPDLLLSRGKYQLKPEPPFTLGLECAGLVLRSPEDCHLAPGNRVVAFVPGGAFAERVAAAPATTFRLPEALSFAEGAALMVKQLGDLPQAERAEIADALLLLGDAALVVGALRPDQHPALRARDLARLLV